MTLMLDVGSADGVIALVTGCNAMRMAAGMVLAHGVMSGCVTKRTLMGTLMGMGMAAGPEVGLRLMVLVPAPTTTVIGVATGAGT